MPKLKNSTATFQVIFKHCVQGFQATFITSVLYWKLNWTPCSRISFCSKAHQHLFHEIMRFANFSHANFFQNANYLYTRIRYIHIWQRLMSYGLCKKSRTASLEFLECHTRPQYVDGENVGPQSPQKLYYALEIGGFIVGSSLILPSSIASRRRR